MDLSTTASPNVANAVETVVSHLHPTPSWDIADHPMPKGLEELWRFTPVKQIRALLLEGDELPGLTWESDLPDGVEFTTEPKERIRELVIEPPSTGSPPSPLPAPRRSRYCECPRGWSFRRLSS